MGLATAISFGSWACSTTATITPYHGSEIEGRIIDGSRTAITLKGADGTERRIPRGQIREIHHPGRAAIGFGIALIVYGIANIIVGVPHCSDKGGVFCVGVFLPGAVGLFMTGWGSNVHSASTEAADRGLESARDDSESAATPPPRAPAMVPLAPGVRPAPAGALPPSMMAPPGLPAASPPATPAPPARQRTDDEDG